MRDIKCFSSIGLRKGKISEGTKSAPDGFLLPNQQMGTIAWTRRAMIAFQAMQVPRGAGGLLQKTSSEILVHSEK